MISNLNEAVDDVNINKYPPEWANSINVKSSDLEMETSKASGEISVIV